MKANQKSNKVKQTRLTNFKENICSLWLEQKYQLKKNPTKAGVANINPTVDPLISVTELVIYRVTKCNSLCQTEVLRQLL